MSDVEERLSTAEPSKREITYEADVDVGKVFKKKRKFRISPDGIEWEGPSRHCFAATGADKWRTTGFEEGHSCQIACKGLRQIICKVTRLTVTLRIKWGAVGLQLSRRRVWHALARTDCVLPLRNPQGNGCEVN